jgi:hypothetical protein
MQNETLCLEEMMESDEYPARVLSINCGNVNSKLRITLSPTALTAKFINSKVSQIGEENFKKVIN